MENSRRGGTVAFLNKEFVGSQCGNQFVNLESKKDHEVAQSPSIRAESIHSNRISRSHSRLESHISHDKEMRNLRLVVGHLRRRLRHVVHKRENRTHSLGQSFNSEGEQSYRRRSSSPPIEYFTTCFRSIGEERYRRGRVETPPPKNIGKDAMGKALHQISRSPFSSHIEEVKLPHRFTQPTLTITMERLI